VWRFSRIVSQEAGENGGGAFLLQWFVFLFTWSIPLILAEYAAGRYARFGVPLTFGKLGGQAKMYVPSCPPFHSSLTSSFFSTISPFHLRSWMGIFMGSVATFIGFYYAVVTGYCLCVQSLPSSFLCSRLTFFSFLSYYLYRSIFFELPTTREQSMEVWDSLQTPTTSIICAVIVILIVCLITWQGVKSLVRNPTPSQLQRLLSYSHPIGKGKHRPRAHFTDHHSNHRHLGFNSRCAIFSLILYWFFCLNILTTV